MELETLGIDDSVAAVFPPTELAGRLQKSPVETIVLEDSQDDIGALDGVVTFAYREAINDHLAKIDEKYVETDGPTIETTESREVGSNPMERSMREEGISRVSPKSPF